MLNRLASRAPEGLILLALSHFLVDLHSGMLPVLLAQKRSLLGLSLAQVGLIAGVYNFSISIGQPLFGRMADRWGERLVAAWGLLWVALCGSGLGFAPGYLPLLGLVALQALGPAAFHPPGAAGAGRLGRGRAGSSMSIFLSGGSLGMAAGPALAGWIFAAAGIQATAWVGLVATGLALALAILLRQHWPASIEQAPRTGTQAAQRKVKASRAFSFWLILGALLLVTAVRTAVHMSLTTFLPQYLAGLGYSSTVSAQGLSLLLLAAMAGVMSGGLMADRFGPRRVVTLSLVLLGSALLGLPSASRGLAAALLPVAGFAVGIPLSMTLVIGQAHLQEKGGFASGLILGVSFVAGAVGVALTGWTASHWGLEAALSALGLITMGAAAAGVSLPAVTPGMGSQKVDLSPS